MCVCGYWLHLKELDTLKVEMKGIKQVELQGLAIVEKLNATRHFKNKKGQMVQISPPPAQHTPSLYGWAQSDDLVWPTEREGTWCARNLKRSCKCAWLAWLLLFYLSPWEKDGPQEGTPSAWTLTPEHQQTLNLTPWSEAVPHRQPANPSKQ